MLYSYQMKETLAVKIREQVGSIWSKFWALCILGSQGMRLKN